MVLVAGWTLLLSRLSGQEEVVVGQECMALEPLEPLEEEVHMDNQVVVEEVLDRPSTSLRELEKMRLQVNVITYPGARSLRLNDRSQCLAQ